MLLKTYLVIRLQEISIDFVQAERRCAGNVRKINLNTGGMPKHWMGLAVTFTNLYAETV
jgi:hypothetical protein